jgi:hypothetical protein
MGDVPYWVYSRAQFAKILDWGVMGVSSASMASNPRVA